jgi:hypothetical protein
VDQVASPAKGNRNYGFYQSVTDDLIRYAKGWVKYETENPRYELQRGTGQYLTTRQAFERAGQESKIDDYEPKGFSAGFVPIFWKLKSLCEGPSDPIKPAELKDYCDCQGVLLNRQDRAIIYSMDAEFRAALAKQRVDNDKFMASKNK